MKRKLFLFLSFFILSTSLHAQTAWPGESWSSATDLSGLDSDFGNNLSGAHWNPVKRELWVCINGPGKFWRIIEDGNNSFMVDTTGGYAEWAYGGDLEGITQADYNDNSVFLIDEQVGIIREFGISSPGATSLLHSWNITSYIPTYDPVTGKGPEGIVFIPNEWLKYDDFVNSSGNPDTASNGMGGLVFVAHQNGGHLYAFDLKRSDNSLTFVGKYATSRGESSDLSFDRSTGKLFIWHNEGTNHIEVTDLLSYDLGGGIRKFYTQKEFLFAKNTGNIEGMAITPASSDSSWYFSTDDTPDQGALRWFHHFEPCIFEPFFTTNKTIACVNESIVITDTTIGLCGSETFNWDFGSGATPLTAIGQGPHTIIYSTPGAKNIKLNISSAVTSDSLIKNSYITINPTYAFTESQNICDGEIYHWHGEDYTSAGTYYDSLTTIYGCDSIYTLHLTVNPVYAFTENHSICSGETYNWRGDDYTAAGTYYDSLITINGCDSIYTLNLTINPVYAFTEDTSICDGEIYNWHGEDYTSSGTYYDSLTTIHGCDSIYALHLTVKTVDVGITLVGVTITVDSIADAYQWANCDTHELLDGDTLQSYTATVNGNYTVIITKGSCTDTSECVNVTSVSIPSTQKEEGIVVYPNPVSNELIIEIKDNKESTAFEIVNSFGVLAFKGSMKEKAIVQTTNFAPGIYFIKLAGNKTIEFKKIIKQ